MQIINLYDEHKRKAVITLCPQKFSSSTMRTNRPLWQWRKLEERWRPEDHACKLGYFGHVIAHKMLTHFQREFTFSLSHPQKNKCSLRHPSVQLEKVLQNSLVLWKSKTLQHNFFPFSLIPHLSSLLHQKISSSSINEPSVTGYQVGAGIARLQPYIFSRTSGLSWIIALHLRGGN